MILSRGVFRAAFPLVLILAVGALVNMEIQLANSQTSENLTALTYEAFSQIAGVYRSGGEAPELVAKLNAAIQRIQEARLMQSQGDEADAVRLEEQARKEILDIISGIPAAREKAQRDSTATTIRVYASVPAVVALSTLIFYVGLRTWRWYEKIRLFEMRIVEKKKKD